MAKNARGASSFALARKPVVTIKIELPVMTSARAYKRALELLEKLEDDESRAWAHRIKAVSVTT